MQTAQDLFYSFAARFVRDETVPSSPTVMPAPGTKADAKKALHNKKKDTVRRNKARAWFFAVIMAIALSVGLIFLLPFIFASMKPGIAAAVFVWAVLLGWLFTFLAPAKWVTALCGALIGSGGPDLAGGDGVVAKLKKISSSTIEMLGVVSPEIAKAEQGFITAMVWMFVVLLAVLCAGAFFKE